MTSANSLETLSSITQRIDAVTHIPGEFRTAHLPPPKSVKIELTGACNYKCNFCPTGSKTGGVKMDWDLFVKVTDELYDLGIREIGLFYLGEPLTAPVELVKSIRHLKGKGFEYLFLTTNGSLCKPELAHQVMDAGVDSIKFSINSDSEEQFAEVTGVNPKFHQKSIDNLRTTFVIRNMFGFKTKIYASSIQYNGEQQARMQKVVDELKPFCDEHYWLPLYNVEDGGAAGNQGRIGGLVESIPCWSAFTEGHILANGEVSVCCFDDTGKMGVGNLNNTSFMEAWNSEPFVALRQAHLDGNVDHLMCKTCLNL